MVRPDGLTSGGGGGSGGSALQPEDRALLQGRITRWTGANCGLGCCATVLDLHMQSRV